MSMNGRRQPIHITPHITPIANPYRQYGRCISLLAGFLFCLSCSSSDPIDGSGNGTGSPNGNSGDPQGTPRFTYRLVNTFPHDVNAFTQGLVFWDGFMYEGTGLNGRSSLRRVELETGEVLEERALDDRYFGEGIALVAERIIQLTLRSNIGFIYDRDSFSLQGDVSYQTPGWGLAYDGSRLIMSDGSTQLYFRDPADFRLLSQVEVRIDQTPLDNLNELEFIKGEVFANIWQTDLIARISPESGQVLGLVDLAGLLTPQERSRADVLNGIAYDAEDDRLFVTGKLWPWLFEIELVPIP